MFGVSRSWVAREAKAGRLPCLYIGGRYRFTPEDVAAIARMHRLTPRIPSRRRLTLVWSDPPADAEPAQPTDRRPPLDVRRWANG